MKTFLNNENVTNSIKENTNTYLKGAGSCIDVISVYFKYSFRCSSSIETDLNDHYYLIFSMMDIEEPKQLVYRNFRTFL